MSTDKKPSQHELNNHANQQNPNNPAYEKSRDNNTLDDGQYVDDWEFNHD